MTDLIIENGIAVRQHRPKLQELLDTTSGEIRVASAYVTDRQFFSSANACERRLLTSLAPMDVASGATKLETVNALIKMGVECRKLPHHPRLHAKVYIFGSSHAVVTSANLTWNGLDSNIEVGAIITGAETNQLVVWFDRLWDIAAPLTVDQLSDMQHEISALRSEFTKLKKRVKVKAPLPRKAKSQRSLTYSLQNLFDTAKRFFVCNTDRRHGGRTPTGGYMLEEEMHTRGFAAAWEDFKYPSHMEKVEPGDAILMFAKGVGIIGVGVADASCEKLSPTEHGRVYASEWFEWRVPTRWLNWLDSDDAFPWKSPNATFLDVTGPKYEKFRDGMMTHFLNSE